MNGWIIYDKKEAKRNKGYIELYLSESKKKNIGIKLIYIELLTFGIKENKPFLFYDKESCKAPDFAIVRTIFPALNKHFEMMRVKTYNNFFVSDTCNDKQKTYQYLSENQISILDTFFVTKTEIKKISYDFPFVLKPARGRGGNNVFLIENQLEFENALKKIPHDDLLIQQVASDKGKDLRVYVIGKNIIASMLRSSHSDFRSNYCLGGTASFYILNEEEIKLINRIIDLFDFGLVGIDFVFHNGKIIFNEIEDIVGSRMLYDKTDLNIVSLYLDCIINCDKTRPSK